MFAAGCCLLSLALPAGASAARMPGAGLSAAARAVKRPLLLAHYLPWYQANPAHHRWGWHWTMNHFQPETVVGGRRQVASRYYPLIGPYDSGDPDVLECQVLQMKFAGIDGAIVDWYGTDDYLDYGVNHRNAQAFIEEMQRAGMRYGVLYEDEVAAARLVKDGRVPADQAVAHGQETLQWMAAHWFSSPGYIHVDGRPVFLTFGTKGYYTPGQWKQIFSVLPQPPSYFTELFPREPARGAFGWPAPFGGTARSGEELDRFYKQSVGWSCFIAPAYPRFQDIYQQAGVSPSWGSIDDANGKTYAATLKRALLSGADMVQIATWNDWGEGTQIEPSAEFGYRDLEATQRLRRACIDPAFPYTAADLRLPEQLYRLRKKYAGQPPARRKLDRIARLLRQGRTGDARRALAAMG
jgi:hypothetical protein